MFQSELWLFRNDDLLLGGLACGQIFGYCNVLHKLVQIGYFLLHSYGSGTRPTQHIRRLDEPGVLTHIGIGRDLKKILIVNLLRVGQVKLYKFFITLCLI